MADKAEEKDPRHADREAELKRQKGLAKAVHDRTHKAGKPVPIVIEG